MHNFQHHLPDVQRLTKNISSVLHENNFIEDPVTILTRETNYHSSTYPSEIITCQSGDGEKIKLLCKYGGDQSSSSHGHRGGISYETKVYRHVLQKVPATTPKFYGAYIDKSSGEIWLLLEFTENALRLKYFSDPSAMRTAAGWIGKFHLTSSSLISIDVQNFLNQYPAEYYLGWSQRTLKFAGKLNQNLQWLSLLCEEFKDVVEKIVELPKVIIHGEYYPMNILVRQSSIFPVDWESAAIAFGEIDLASLVENWPRDFVEAAKDEYQKSRWPKSTPADFEFRINAAQLYWQFRWLGEDPEKIQKPETAQRVERLKIIGEEMGLI